MTPRAMKVVRNPTAVRGQVRQWRARGLRVGFVPTMGALHEGHLSLVRLARRHSDRVVLSIFVNPTQFAPHEDLRAYPRPRTRDLRLSREEGVDLCFTPSQAVLYAPDRCTEVRVKGLDEVLEGSTRTTHFAGVALVVTKLLNIVEPDELVLGQKDAQQAVILERLVRDLDLPVKVRRGAIVREPDGLALSSRNAYLTPRQRESAPALYRGLCRARKAIKDGERSPAKTRRLVQRELAAAPGVREDYVALVNARTLEPLRRLEGRVLLAAAAYLGRTRIIDNLEFAVRNTK